MHLKSPVTGNDVALLLDDLSIRYGDKLAIADVTLPIFEREILALIGSSGCGKSSLLRTMNRIHEVYGAATISGNVYFHGQSIFDEGVDVTMLRRRIGMVFQLPNPFPMSIKDNVIFGPKLFGVKDKRKHDEIVEQALRDAHLWEDVKDRLDASGLSLSGGQQQRLCIARTLATDPEVILMDEPCSSLDPVATSMVEDTIQDLSQDRTIVLVTHNIEQAKRVAHMVVHVGYDEARDCGIIADHIGKDELLLNGSKNPRTQEFIEPRVEHRFLKDRLKK